MDENTLSIIKSLVPLLTFIAGIIFTLVLKKIESNQKVIKTAVEDALRLSKEWYAQIQALAASDKGYGHRTMDREVYEYIHGRLVLPNFLTNVGILQKTHKAGSLVHELENFLSIVTDYDPKDRVSYGIRCRMPFETNEEFSQEIKRTKARIEKRDIFLKSLDDSIQRIAKECANLLK
jgi:hypothetical protein